MQVHSLPANNQKIEFSEYQLELVAELTAESLSFHDWSITSISKATYIAIVLSAIFHIILFTSAFSYMSKSKEIELQPGEEKKAITVKFIGGAKPEKTIKKKEIPVKEVKREIQEKKIVKSNLNPKQKKDIVEPIKSAAKIITQKNKLKPAVEAQIEPQEKTMSELDPLIYDKNIEIYEPVPGSLNEGTIVFNPKLRKRIAEIQKEKFKRSKITGYMQRQKDNEYFEFKPEGGSQTVRINGNCFSVQKHDAFAIGPQVWSLLGSCEEPAPKLNFEKPELKYRYNESGKQN